MTAYNRLFKGLRVLMLAAAPLLAGGCSDDNAIPDDDLSTDGTPTEITVALTARRAPEAPAPDGAPVNPGADTEKIDSWWIAFVDHNGKTVKIIDRGDTGTTLLSDGDAVEAEKFKCIVPAGYYTLYAFANIDRPTLEEATGLKFEAGKKTTLPTGISKIEDAVWKTSLNGLPSDRTIPMSGILKNVRIKNTVEETFSIEVVRMVAKMEFLFHNVSEQDVTVESVSVDPVTTSAISLFPRGASGFSTGHLGFSSYTPLSDAEYAMQTFSITGDKVIKTGVEEPVSKTVYLQESISDRPNGETFTIGVKVRHGDGSALYEQYNLTTDILSYINRNDHIRIPVSLSRYAVEVEALFYPPIGGYPAALSSTDPKGAQIFTFSTEGDFAIVPHIFDKTTGKHLPAARYSVTLGNVEAPESFFIKAPTVTAASPSLPDEVTGELGNVKGKALAPLSVEIYDRPRYESGAKKVAVYTRMIYLIRN